MKINLNTSDDKESAEPVDAVSIFNDQTSEKHYDFHFALPTPASPKPPPVAAGECNDAASGPIQLPDELLLVGSASAKKLKLNSGKLKRKIRKLTNESESSGEDILVAGNSNLTKLFRLRSLILVALTVLTAVLVGAMMKTDLRKDFYRRYKRQYQLLVYGAEDYCSQEMDLYNVTLALEKQVVGQQDAINDIVNFFYQNQDHMYSAVALLGPTGVGKSLMASVISKNFQWKANVHQYSLDGVLGHDAEYSRFQSFIYNMRHSTAPEISCGHNLLVIHNVGSEDFPLINKINDRMKFVATKENARFTVLLDCHNAAVDYKRLNQLNADIERIFLIPMELNDLRSCIRLEAMELGAKLDDKIMDDVLNSVHVQNHGCKPVRAKLLYALGIKSDF